MPNLRELNLKLSYGPSDDRLREFFIPAMAASVRYDRAAGYFSSTMLAVAAAGITKLIQNGGKMRLLCGADLSEDDVEAIRRGHETLEQGVAKRMGMRLVLPESDFVQRRLEALAWLVGTGQLEIKVVLPTAADGRPLPASKTDCYYHPKEGVFTDSEGNQVAFSGSVNESAVALEDNYESFAVFNTWETPAYVGNIRVKFDKLWAGREIGWVALPIPEAVKNQLLKFRPTIAPQTEYGVDEPPPEKKEPTEDDQLPADQRERIIFQFLRDVPHLLASDELGVKTCAIELWPHQHRVVDRIVSRFPERFLLCDEVGLGKTIQAGLALRQLTLSGVVQRALILVPKSVLVQWQEELYEKFVLNVPRYDGGMFYDVFGRQLPNSADDGNPWNAYPIMLASSHLAKRRDRQQELLAARDWDLVIVDEAHHARRKDFLNTRLFRPNRLLELLRGPDHRPGLCDKTRGLLLLTATPMQIDPRELFDLLKLLGTGGRWGVESSFLRYFNEVRQPFDEIDWSFVLHMLNDYFTTGGDWDETFCRFAQQRLGPVKWDQVRQLTRQSAMDALIRQLDKDSRDVLRKLATCHTPIRRHVVRNTRSLLREYQKRGYLKAVIPYRDPQPMWIDLRPDERELYERIDVYIRDHYQKYESERKGLGFIMTVYRRRLTSSFYAITKSLERRLAYLKGELASWLADEDVDEEDLDQDVSELLPLDDQSAGQPALSPLFAGEIEYVQDFLADLRGLGTDSKFEQLTRDLNEILMKRDSVIVFTQYTDTMDYLRDKLRLVYGDQVACYSGRGGERWDGSSWVGTSKENIKTAFRESREIKILLCTESASEGLNLQTCGVLINYEMPWNPMRVEQRIGRIDRIGQVYERVWIRNYFYDKTVEATVYQRLDERIASFESIVGELQPILTRVAHVIEKAAMAGEQLREEMIDREIEEINRQVESHETSSLNLGTLAAQEAVPVAERGAPVTLQELERTLVESSFLRDRFRPHPELPGAHLLDWHGQWVPVTFDPQLYDEHPNTLRLLTYGGGLLEELLEVLEPPVSSTRAGTVARCSLAAKRPMLSYYATNDRKTIPTLKRLRETLQSHSPTPIDADLQSQLESQFTTEVNERLAQEDKVERDRRRARQSSLEEEVRQLLVEAAYVELALAANPDLFDEPLPLDFSEQAYERLKRHKVPFAGALRLCGTNLPRPREDDPLYLQLTGENKERLHRRFEAVRTKLIERLRELVEVRRAVVPIRPSDPNLVAPEIACFAPTVSRH